MRIPRTLAWWRGVPGGAAWLDGLPGIVSICAEQWSLEVGEPFTGGNVALVLSATTRDGASVVLKVSFPDEESRHEADALAFWKAVGAVALLEHDDESCAMLLERVDPGTPLWDIEDDEQATTKGADVLRLLHRTPTDRHPYRLLADEAARWAESIPAGWRATGRGYPRELVELAIDACRTLPAGGEAAVVLHGDFHGGNILRSRGRGWLAIDPKPLVGDAAFDPASLLRDRR